VLDGGVVASTIAIPGEGIVLFGGFGPAEDNLLDGTVLGNRIPGTPRHAVRVIGGVGLGGRRSAIVCG
jgi:hypothetical protein